MDQSKELKNIGNQLEKKEKVDRNPFKAFPQDAKEEALTVLYEMAEEFDLNK